MYDRPDERYPANWQKLRHWVFHRDNYTCQICGRKGLKQPHCHHIIPIGRGGSSHPINLITVCLSCHKHVHNI